MTYVKKPIWMYDIQRVGWLHNIDITQKFQSKAHRAISGYPWYIRNKNIRKVLCIPMIKNEIKDSRKIYSSKLRDHPNPCYNPAIMAVD